MQWWLLAAQIFAFPVANGYAVQVKSDVVVSVTYTDVVPERVCTFLYALDDEEMKYPVANHCWEPDNVVGDQDVWPNLRLDEGNFVVTIKNPGKDTIKIYLVSKINT